MYHRESIRDTFTAQLQSQITVVFGAYWPNANFGFGQIRYSVCFCSAWATLREGAWL